LWNIPQKFLPSKVLIPQTPNRYFDELMTLFDTV